MTVYTRGMSKVGFSIKMFRTVRSRPASKRVDGAEIVHPGLARAQRKG
jgi:hypothetical protein